MTASLANLFGENQNVENPILSESCRKFILPRETLIWSFFDVKTMRNGSVFSKSKWKIFDYEYFIKLKQNFNDMKMKKKIKVKSTIIMFVRKALETINFFKY